MILAVSVLAHTAPTNMARLEVWAAIGAVVGVILFIRGFQMLRFKRLIMNTPASKIRSASLGLVEISGTAQGASTMPAGITGQACYYYRAIAWQLRQSGRNREWTEVANESFYVPFFVQDSTGQLLVDPPGANLDLPRNFKDEFDTSFFSSNRDVLPENVAQFFARNGVSFRESTRVEEYCIKPDSPLFVFGTLGQNSNRRSWAPGPHVASGTQFHAHLNFLGAGRTPLEWLRLTSGGSAIGSKNDNDMPAVSPAALSRTPPASPASIWSEVSLDEVAVSGRDSSVTRFAGTRAVSPPVATAEPDNPSDSLPLEAPSIRGYDLDPLVSIGKGTGNEPFVISWRSQREVVRSLAWKSVLCIWGGPALSLICLYFLAVCIGWR
jgi:hypothetical protein